MISSSGSRTVELEAVAVKKGLGGKGSLGGHNACIQRHQRDRNIRRGDGKTSAAHTAEGFLLDFAVAESGHILDKNALDALGGRYLPDLCPRDFVKMRLADIALARFRPLPPVAPCREDASIALTASLAETTA